jgi:hypothetical protein
MSISRGKYFLDTLEGAFTGDDFHISPVFVESADLLTAKPITVFVSLAHDMANGLNSTEGTTYGGVIRDQYFLISALFNFERTNDSRDFRTEMAIVREKIDIKLAHLVNVRNDIKTYTHGGHTITYRILNIYIDDYFLDDVQTDETRTVGQILISGHITYINDKI